MKVFVRLMIVAFIVTSLATVVRAEGIKPGSFTVSGILGGYTFDGEQHTETRPVYGLRGGYNFTEHWGIEGLFDYVRTEGTRSDIGDINLYRYGAEVLFHAFPDNTLVPYLAAGYVGITTDQERQRTDNKGAFDYGVGVKYFLSDKLALRGDFRHMVFREGVNFVRPGEYHREGTRYNYEYTAGLLWQFGGQPAQPVAVAPEPPAVNIVPSPPVEKETPPQPVPATEPAPGRYKYCMTLNLQFDIDKASIRSEDHREVARVGEFMNRYPDTTAVIEGHTDTVGTDQYNLELSRKRSESVVNYLVDHFGIARSRLSSTGYGATRPLADNATDAGKQKNRRIEAIIDCAFDVTKITPPERLCMALQIEFDTGRADILPSHHDEVARVGEYMKQHQSTTALIEGHTDNTGTNAANERLSRERAENVVTYLVDNFGIERGRLAAKGYGSQRRIAYNTTAEGRKKNRRINAIIDCVIK